MFSPQYQWGFSFCIDHLCGLLSFLLYEVNWTQPWLKTQQKINQFLFAVKQKHCGQLLRCIHTIRGTPKHSNRDLLCNVVTYLLQNLFHWVFTVISTWLSNLVTFKQTGDNSGILFIAVMPVTSKKSWMFFVFVVCSPPLLPAHPSRVDKWSAFGVNANLRFECYFCRFRRFAHRKDRCETNYTLAIIPLEWTWELF